MFINTRQAATQTNASLRVDGVNQLQTLYTWMALANYRLFTRGWRYPTTDSLRVDGVNQLQTLYAWMALVNYRLFMRVWH